MPDQPLRAVIIGCGRIAGGYNEHDDREPLTHVVAYRQAGVPVVGCCDRDGERAKMFAARWDIDVWGTDVATVLRRTRPDLVSVCTGPVGRVELIEQIGDSPARAVLLEKPLAAGAGDAARIQQCLQAWGRPALVNYLRAFDPWYRRLERDVRSGAFGGLREIAGRYYGDASTNAAHLLERVLAMCGQPVAVRRLSGSRHKPLFELAWDDGRVARFLPTEGCSWSPFELDLLFDSSRVRVIDSEQRSEWFSAAPHPRFPEFATLHRDEARRDAGPSVGPLNHAMCALVAASRGEAFDAGLLQRAVDVTRILEEIGR